VKTSRTDIEKQGILMQEEKQSILRSLDEMLRLKNYACLTPSCIIMGTVTYAQYETEMRQMFSLFFHESPSLKTAYRAIPIQIISKDFALDLAFDDWSQAQAMRDLQKSLQK